MPANGRMTGKIKWFNAQKGFGFIGPDTPILGVDRDLFVHASALPEGAEPSPDERVSFAIETGRSGRKQAADVRFV